LRYICFIIAATITLFPNTTTASELIFTTSDFPPYGIKGDKGVVASGHDVEVVTEVFKRKGYNVKLRFLPWKRTLAMAKNGQSTAIISCAYTKEREDFIKYSDPISTGTSSLISRSDYTRTTPKKLHEALGRKIVSVSGYAYTTQLQNAKIPHYEAVNDAAALNLLLKRNFDLFFSSREIIQYKSKKQNISESLKFHNISQMNFFLCFSRKWPNYGTLVEAFNIGLAEIKADGTYEKIHRKYR